MTHRIKVIELMDGNKIYDPVDDDLLGLDIKSIIIEKTITKAQYETLVGKKMECEYCNKIHNDKIACVEYGRR